MMRPTLLIASVVVLLIAPVAARCEENRWRKLPYPPGRANTVAGIALEGQTLWAMFQNVVYWDGEVWRRPAGQELGGSMFLAKFLGGGDQPLYCTQPTSQQNVGVLLKLSNGAAEPVLEFPFDRPTDPPNIVVSREGKILNFTESNFSVFDGNRWVDFPLKEKSWHLLFDRGAKVDVFFPSLRKLFTVGAGNEVSEREIELPFDLKTSITGARWSDNSAIIVGHRLTKAPVLLNLETGEVSAAKVPALAYYDAFAMLDGGALILARGKDPGYLLFHFSPDGEFSEVPGSRDLRWESAQFRPMSVVERPRGELWIGGTGQTILRFANLTDDDKSAPDDATGQRATWSKSEYGRETGLDLSNCRNLAIDKLGNVFAANSRGIYQRFAQEPPEHLPAPRRPERLGKALWQWKPKQGQVGAAWNDGDSLLVTSNDGTITSLSDRGAVRFESKIDRYAVQSASLVKSSEKNRVKLGTAEGITLLDAESGKPLERLPIASDPRITPVPIEGGYLITPRNRARAIEGVDEVGEKLWTAKLPGYVMVHPAKHDHLAIVQTRSDSYGEQETVCVDTRDGRIVWQDVTNAYGVGAAFASHGKFVVEGNQKMSPAMTKGWVICREPETGKKRWEYEVDGSIDHPPIVDTTDELVFAVFSRGEVVCLHADDGRIIWESKLPDNALPGVSASYEAAWSPHSTRAGRLLVVDCNHVLHAFGQSSGKVSTGVLLTSSPGEKLVGPPWVTDQALVVPTSSGVTGYQLPPQLSQHRP